MAKKITPASKIVTNRRARFDYDVHDQLHVGIVLTGPEVRAARDGRVNLVGSYVTVKGNELWLTNASFSIKPTSGKHEAVVDSNSRKLLARKQEIVKLLTAKEQGLTIVPLNLLAKGRFIKLTIATAKGKKLYDKREAIKKRDTEREARRFVKPH